MCWFIAGIENPSFFDARGAGGGIQTRILFSSLGSSGRDPIASWLCRRTLRRSRSGPVHTLITWCFMFACEAKGFPLHKLDGKSSIPCSGIYWRPRSIPPAGGGLFAFYSILSQMQILPRRRRCISSGTAYHERGTSHGVFIPAACSRGFHLRSSIARFRFLAAAHCLFNLSTIELKMGMHDAKGQGKATKKCSAH